jgi:cell division protein FtsL
VTRLNLILLVLLVACSLSVVTAQHRARKVFMELTQELHTATALDVEFDRLRLEQRTWAMHSRIEKVARQDLGMQAPQADHTRVLSLYGVALQP